VVNDEREQEPHGGRGGGSLREKRGWHHSPRQKPSRGRRGGVVELTMISVVLRFQLPEV